MCLQFGETAYIAQVNRARKVKSDAQVATNKNKANSRRYHVTR